MSAAVLLLAVLGTSALAASLRGATESERPRMHKTDVGVKSVEVKVTLVKTTAEDIVVRVTVVNNGKKPFALLNWNLPEGGGLSAPLFVISRDGQPVRYHGKMVKRRVTSESYLRLKPGKEYAAEIPLAQAYDVKQPGKYKISYHAWNQTEPGVMPEDVLELTSRELLVDKH